jgi:hypothetical protein
MVARTTPDIIDGHNGIWGEDLTKWMIGFMLELHKRASACEKDLPALTPNPALNLSAQERRS